MCIVHSLLLIDFFYKNRFWIYSTVYSALWHSGSVLVSCHATWVKSQPLDAVSGSSAPQFRDHVAWVQSWLLATVSGSSAPHLTDLQPYLQGVCWLRWTAFQFHVDHRFPLHKGLECLCNKDSMSYITIKNSIMKCKSWSYLIITSIMISS